MISFVLRRVLTVLPVLVGATVFTFVVMRLLPADPAAFLASGPGMGAADIAALRAKLGLDRSLPVQFGLYAWQLLHGDFGHSFVTGNPVALDLLQRLPASLELACGGLLIAAVIGMPLGIAAALRPGSLFDTACRALAVLGGALPGFVIGVFLIYLCYFKLSWAPEPTGQIDAALSAPRIVTGFLVIDSLLAGNMTAFASALGRMVLPSLTMALFALAPVMRMTRAAMVTALASDYIRSSRALGLPNRLVLRYALENAGAPLITMFGLIFSYMLGANVVVEKVFAWPGIGAYALDGLQAADYSAVQGFILVVAAVFAAVNLLVDLLCGWADPRIPRAA
ncbi:ABC transporter permease [Acidisoma silvae]|uniref:ABC transporter permease n=1 Tax=Acidisoma silvae TaxID=2802396 RepID=UPI001D0A5745|nr:ABC transporter permease [Acidisoma silvae]